LAEKKAEILSVKSLTVAYGNKTVLSAVSFSVDRAEIVALIGHNGAGKSTLLKALFGIVPSRGGIVAVDGTPIAVPSPRSLIQRGAAFVPQGNRVFGELTVRENLRMGGITIRNEKLLNERIQDSYAVFPPLKTKSNQKASALSGGEKQMLALANAVILQPRLLMLDEPSLGLSPKAASEVLAYVSRICREGAVAVLIVEQRVRDVLKIANRVIVLRAGAVAFAGAAEELADDRALREVYF
jgi:branched-chain amino acid transport system ATP-binding protein